MRNLFFLILFISILPLSSSKAQLEVGVQAGLSNYLGDLAPTGLWTSLGETNFSAGVFARYNIGYWVSVRGGFNYAKISANDATKNANQAKLYRNLSFRSNIYEFGLIAEVNIMGYQPYNLERVFSPYVFIGIAGFKFNPQAFYDGRWYDLQPLGTEGQGMNGKPDPYKLFQMAIPMGVGAKYAINDKWNLGLEVGLRKTFTDYLDDVSATYVDLVALENANGELAAELSWRGDEVNIDNIPPQEGRERGDATKLDWYLISGITVSYNFTDNGLVGSRGKLRRKKGCATF